MRIMDLVEFEQTQVNITDDVSELPDKVLVNIVTGVRAQTSEYVYPATTETVGGVRVGKGLIVDKDGTLDAEVTAETLQQSIPEIPKNLSYFENDVGFITDTVENLKNFYNKTEIKELLSTIPKFSIKPVDKLPETAIDPNTLYLVKNTSEEGENLYQEYMYIGGSQPKQVPGKGDAVNSIYFNTKLSVEQVVSLLNNSGIDYTSSGSTKSYVIAANPNHTKFVSVDIYTAYNIYGIGYTDTEAGIFTPYFFNDYNETYRFKGWNPNMDNPVQLNFTETSTTSGSSNIMLKSMISVTPYVEGKWELLGSATIDYSNLALKSEIPTQISQLQNDSNFITKDTADKTYAKINEIPTGGLKEIPVATDSTLGGIKTGFGNSQKGFYGVKVNEDQRGYVMIPAVEYSPQNLTEEEKGVVRDNIGALGREQAKDLYQTKGNYITSEDLPIATETKFGMIRPGSGLVINRGILSVSTGAEADSVQWKNIKNNPLTVTDVKLNV